MIVRPEQARDVPAIRALLYAAFENHPHHAPGSPPTEHLIVDGLRAAGALTLSLVAEEGGQVIGHIAFSPVLVSQAACDWYGLGPVAVLPGMQLQGVTYHSSFT